MKRKTAIRKLMGYGASRNNAKKYLDDMHKRAHATNEYTVTQYVLELLVAKAIKARGMSEVGE